MTPFSDAGRKNLREGIKKMNATMSPAATVRRNFRLGRPAKVTEELPLHRMVVWVRANKALASFRGRLSEAGLDPAEAQALIVYVRNANPTAPEFIYLEPAGKTSDEAVGDALLVLGGDDVVAIGMVFEQFEPATGSGKKSLAIFPYQFTGLSPEGVLLLRKACAIRDAGYKSQPASC